MRHGLFAGAALGLIFAASAAQAVVVDISSFGGGDYAPIPKGFGNSGPVSLDWNPLNIDGQAVLKWNGGFSGDDGSWCRSGIDCTVRLTVASGFSVTFDSFKLGGYSNSDRSVVWSVVDLATSTTVKDGTAAVPGSAPLAIALGLSSETGFDLRFGPDGYNGGPTELTYSYRTLTSVPVTSPGSTAPPATGVPEPMSLALLGAGLLGLGAARRRTA